MENKENIKCDVCRIISKYGMKTNSGILCDDCWSEAFDYRWAKWRKKNHTQSNIENVGKVAESLTRLGVA